MVTGVACDRLKFHNELSQPGMANRNSVDGKYLYLQATLCTDVEGTCDTHPRYDENIKCAEPKAGVVCGPGYFRTRDREYCATDADFEKECGKPPFGFPKPQPQPNPPSQPQPQPVGPIVVVPQAPSGKHPKSQADCAADEVFTRCPRCLDATCDQITDPLDRSCTKNAQQCRTFPDLEEKQFLENCRLAPACLCKLGHARKNGKCVPDQDCFPPRCGKHSHWDPCPLCADFTCDSAKKNPMAMKQRSLAPNCLPAGCRCDENFVRPVEGAKHCVNMDTACDHCKGANEVFLECTKCPDLKCDMLAKGQRAKPESNFGALRGLGNSDICGREGCYCVKGFARDNQNKCVPENQCPGVTQARTPPGNDDDDGCY
jgi:hypothetical protein